MKSLWLEAIGSAAIASCGALLGYYFSRLRKPWWMLGYFLPLLMIVSYRVAMEFPSLAFVPPASWMMMGLKKFALLGFVATMVLTTPLSRLPKQRERYVVIGLMVVYVFVNSVWPFLAPLFNRSELEHIKTDIARDGVCRQTTDYTCGPAAAVTALHKLGLSGQEGKIAILSHTSSSTGTPPDLLAEALQKEYGRDGLIAQYRPFKSIEELKNAGLTLAVIKFGFLVDHFVAVLEVTDTEVIIGDPLEGLNKLSHDEFLAKWRFCGITLKRQKRESIGQ